MIEEEEQKIIEQRGEIDHLLQACRTSKMCLRMDLIEDHLQRDLDATVERVDDIPPSAAENPY